MIINNLCISHAFLNMLSFKNMDVHLLGRKNHIKT